jgi:glycosyltransferase involved in cell wall biosynthesis
MDRITTAGNLISIVIPVLDEQDSLGELATRVLEVADAGPYSVELIFVDDGSHDRSWDVIHRLATDPRVTGIRFRRNFGKAAALAAGFQAAKGDVVIQMDADLQDDPAEIPGFLETLEKGFDVVNGARRRRRDPWHKIYPSLVFNWMVSTVTGLQLRDHNCGFKCARAEVIRELTMYGDMHRYIPVLAHARGFRVGEQLVEHSPRRWGRSKYGFRRFLRGFLDLLTVGFLTGFGQRPLHFFGAGAVVSAAVGGAGLTYAVASLLLDGQTHPVIAISSVLLLLFGLHLVAIGLAAELLLWMTVRNIRTFSVLERTAGKAETPRS